MTLYQKALKKAKDDEGWKAALDKVTDPIEALRVILDNESFFGFDPYYRDLRAAMIGMAERVMKANGG